MRKRRRTGHWHDDRVSTEVSTQSPVAGAQAATLIRQISLLYFAAIAFAIGLHLLLADPFDLRVASAGAILAAGCAVDLRVERTAPYGFGLPGLKDGPPAPSKVPSRVYPLVSAVMVAAFVALQAVNLSAATSLALAAVALIAWAIASDSVLRRVRQAHKVARALREYAPTIGIGFAGRSGGPWQLRMWEPYLLRSGERCVIFNLNEQYLGMIREGGGLDSPIVQIGSHARRDLAPLLVRSLKALFYVQNAQRNAVFLAKTRITHVWLNHGDSDKPANYNSRHALYDRVVVCGQAGVDRYGLHGVNIPAEKFDILGRPQAAGVTRARVPISEVDVKVVMYAPTWHGVDPSANFSSLSFAREIVQGLIDRGCTVIFRPHPLSERWRIRREIIQDVQQILQADSNASGRPHVWGERAEKTWSVVECANHADALISDVSSVVSDFLQSGKPYAMVSMHAPAAEFRAEFSVAETGYVVLKGLPNFDEVLDDLLDADPLAHLRAARKRYVLGDFAGEESADAFAEYVRGLVGHTS